MNPRKTTVRYRNAVRVSLCCMLLAGWATIAMAAQWKPHVVRQINGAASEIRIPAKLQIVTEPWNRVAAIPYLVYMPEKKRLLMLVNCNVPHQPMLMSSDDQGTTWSEPKYLHVDEQGKPDYGLYTGLTYLGNGKLLVCGENQKDRWRSLDYGQTWQRIESKVPLEGGSWDPLLVIHSADGRVERVVQTYYQPAGSPGYDSRACFRVSLDEGQTWSDATEVPQWLGINEVNLIVAASGDWVAACRTDLPRKPNFVFDHFSGLGVSISKDKGATWSGLKLLYEWGRHHPSMVLLPSGELVMSYVVRLGYIHTPDGFPQFGIEAVVSRDNGQTWDLDHRYLLHTWVGNRKGPDVDTPPPAPSSWFAGPQSTTSVLLPDGSILTAFGTGYRSQPSATERFAPRDIGLVLWRLGDQPLNDDRTIRDAPFDSDFRNLVDPATGRHGSEPGTK